MLSAEEKLSKFSMKVLDNANQKRNAMLDEFKAEQEKVLQAKELEFLEDAYQKIQESISSIRKEQNEKESTIENDYRINLLTTRKQIFDDVFTKVCDKLTAFMQTTEYDAWLKKHIDSGLAKVGEGDIVIYLDRADESKINALKSAYPNCTVEISKDEMMGGCKVYNQSCGMISDDSFASEIDVEKLDFVKNSGLNINLL